MRKLFLLWMVLIASYSMAQYKTGFGSISLKDADYVNIGDLRYRLGEDTVNHELVASVIEYVGSGTTVFNKIPKKVKHEKKTYILRGIEYLSKDCQSIVVPSTVRFFGGCGSENLSSIEFEKGSELRIICDYAFSSTQIGHITLPETVDSIGSYAFWNCKKLVSISLPRTLKYIKDRAFKDCSSLTYVNCLNNPSYNAASEAVRKSNLSVIRESTFEGCKSLQKLEIPSFSQFVIEKNAFLNCENLKTVCLGTGVAAVGFGAFENCKNLVTLASNDGFGSMGKVTVFKKVGTSAFRNCHAMKDFSTIADSIMNGACSNCTSLTDVNLNAVKYIGDYAFFGCKNLRSVSLNEVKYIGETAFSQCDALQYINGTLDNVEFAEDPRKTFANPYHISCSPVPVALSYKFFATSHIRKGIEKWQKKKEYETTKEFYKRVTEESRKQKMAQLADSARNAYIKQYAPRTLKVVIENYDADEGVFKMRVDNINQYQRKNLDGSNSYMQTMGEQVYVFAKVPVSEAPAFKEHFKEVKTEPEYCISKNYLGIASCKFKLNGKIYNSPKLYDDETANVTIDLPPLEIDLSGGKRNDMAQSKQQIPIDNEIDQNIPTTDEVRKNHFAVIIGNENYSQVAPVPFAENDAKVFAEYCRKTLGMPKENVRTYGNATYAGFVQAVNDIKKIAEAYHGNISVIFYYAGHGLPNEKNNDAYLLPVDGDGKQLEVCYSVARLYKELGALGANNVTVFLDACFSGSLRGEGMLASARGVAIKAKAEAPQGNMVVFSAASGDETAYPYNQKGHGLFTYFLLKKLRETKGDCSLQELGEYIQTNVKQQSVVINRKSQTPTVNISQACQNNWQTIKLR